MAGTRNLFSRVYRKVEQKQSFIVGILASPRIGGNCDILLDRALQAAGQNGAATEKIVINNLRFVPCQDCEQVKDNGQCKIEDDFQRIYAAVIRADSIIVASPIYFGSISAQLKMVIDRFQCYWRAKYLTKTITNEFSSFVKKLRLTPISCRR